MKEFIVKEDQAFRIRVKSWKCLSPNTLNAVEFIQECIKDGEVDFTSTYQFFMTDDEMKTLAQGLTA
jgi:dissimilatory sulfite reductase (desulfoviridin) alpha/beta subunit